MKRITQILKYFLAFLLDLNFLIFLFNLIVVFLTLFLSKRYGDFIALLHNIENNPQYFFSLILFIILFLLILYFVVFAYFFKNTLGLELFSFKIIPENNISLVNLFLKFITGFLVDTLLFIVNIFNFFGSKNMISSYISDLNIEELEFTNSFKFIIGTFTILILGMFNFYFYYTNIPFKLGKHLTNYEKLLNYATVNKNVNLLQNFIQEYKISKAKESNKLLFYNCILSVLQNNLNQNTCKQVKENINVYSDFYKKIFYGYMGDYYFLKSNYKDAISYYEYFYDNAILNNYYWKYLLSLKNINVQLLIKKLNNQFDKVLNSNNFILVYNISLLYIDNQDFNHAIKLLQKLKNVKPKTIDYADVLWYLGKSQFLSKDYKQAIDNMKQASELNTTKYKILLESYESYYKTQVQR